MMYRLSQETRAHLLTLARPTTLPTGAQLVRQGDPQAEVFLLQAKRPDRPACVKVTAALGNGSETLLGIRISGDIIGELAALRRGSRTATVTTCSPTVVHALSHENFRRFLKDHPLAWEALCRMIADRLDWANRRRLDFAAYEVPVRLARVLVELATRHGIQVTEGLQLGVPLSQAELGRLIGAREDAVGQALRVLRGDGLVRPSYRTVTITDVAALHHYAQLDDEAPIG